MSLPAGLDLLPHLAFDFPLSFDIQGFIYEFILIIYLMSVSVLPYTSSTAFVMELVALFMMGGVQSMRLSLGKSFNLILFYFILFIPFTSFIHSFYLIH